MEGGMQANRALSALPVPFLVLGPVEGTGGRDLQILWANPSALSWFGEGIVGRWLNRDEPLGRMESLLTDSAPGRMPRRLITVEREVVRSGRAEQLRCTLVPVEEG